MGLLDAAVHVIKSEIRLIKEAISEEHDGGYVSEVVPEDDFNDLLMDIMNDFDDKHDRKDGDVFLTDGNDG